MAARIASGKTLSARAWSHVGGRAAAAAPDARTAGILRRSALPRCARGMNQVINEPGGTAYAWRIAEPGFEMAGKTGTAQVRVITKRRARPRRDQEREPGLEAARPCAVHRLSRRSTSRDTPAPASSSMAPSARIRRCRWRATSCCSPRSAIRLGMPTAYPVNGGAAAPTCRQGRRLMTTRPYAAAKRTLSVADKLLEVNWGLVLLITLIALAGFAMLYSVAGGHFHPWALPQMCAFPVGPVVLVAVGDDRYPRVDEPGLSRLWRGAAAADRGGLAGHVGLGAQRWIELGPLGSAAVGADEDRAGAGAGALPARQERRGSLQAAAVWPSRWR